MARIVISGAFAGAVSAFVFAIIHAVFISDIWFSAPAMMVAGALCGACIAWSYTLLGISSSIGSWLRYNALYDLMFVLLGLISVLIFEPMTTLAELLALNGPPDELIRQTTPMTVGFMLTTAVILSAIYGWRRHRFAAILVTCIVLVLLLGLNVSTIGLVQIPRSSFYLIAEMFGLILALNAVYVVVFLALAGSTFRYANVADGPALEP